MAQVSEVLREAPVITSLGLEVLAISVLAVKPKPETARALQAEAREELLRRADEAIYARRDADAVADALQQTGFQTVVLKGDLGRDAMRDALRTFRDAADNADWGVIYYAGHGLQIGKANYLVPVDARLRDERDVPGETIASGELEAVVAGAKGLRLIILDACRVNPFAGRWRG